MINTKVGFGLQGGMQLPAWGQLSRGHRRLQVGVAYFFGLKKCSNYFCGTILLHFESFPGSTTLYLHRVIIMQKQWSAVVLVMMRISNRCN